MLDGQILLDLPPTAIPRMYRLGMDPTRIEVIFLTHMHADHTFGLPFLLLEYCVRRLRSEPLTIVGPVGIREHTFEMCDLAWPQLRNNGFGPKVPLRFVEIPEDGSYRANGVAFEAVRMEHFTLDAFGYRLGYKGRKIAYTGDTGASAPLDRLLSGADVALIELTHAHASDDPGHMDLPAFSALAEELLRKGTRVIATHMGT
ncbi:MAG TPA: ribonuclease Z, partial [Candidatus Acetothermia bacterium]|nr:ribonuclease Z [Candidatus Acetothermia bacterium]